MPPDTAKPAARSSGNRQKLTDALRNIPFIGEAADALLATGALAESVITGMLVRDRIIVLDDLERRDAALSLETLFGYVDALKGKGCTVLLIYNEEELSANQGKEWRAVREKCLDAEINLRPTPTDACELGLAPDCADRAAIQATALQLGLTNIRIIKRLERLTGTFRQLMSAQAAPCTAGFRGQQPGFLGALHCDTQLPADAVQRFLDDWATYSANQLSSKTAGDFVLPATRSGVSSDAELLRLLADFVLQQQLDASGVHARIQHLDARSRYANGQQAAVDYVDKASYDPDASEQMLLDIATKWAKTGWHTLSPQLASTIIHDLERRNAPALAAEISDAWREHWQNASSEYVADSVLEGLATPIATAIREVNDFRRPAMTVLQAIEGINADPQSASREYMPFLQNIDAEALQRPFRHAGARNSRRCCFSIPSACPCWKQTTTDIAWPGESSSTR